MTKLVARQMGTMRVMNQSEVGKHSICLSIVQYFQYSSVFFRIFNIFQYFQGRGDHASDEPERSCETFNIFQYFSRQFGTM